jgi:hypothetical protein
MCHRLDFHARREVKPIFMRRLVLDGQPKHPNFNPQSSVVDSLVWSCLDWQRKRFSHTIIIADDNATCTVKAWC